MIIIKTLFLNFQLRWLSRAPVGTIRSGLQIDSLLLATISCSVGVCGHIRERDRDIDFTNALGYTGCTSTVKTTDETTLVSH